MVHDLTMGGRGKSHDPVHSFCVLVVWFGYKLCLIFIDDVLLVH